MCTQGGPAPAPPGPRFFVIGNFSVWEPCVFSAFTNVFILLVSGQNPVSFCVLSYLSCWRTCSGSGPIRRRGERVPLPGSAGGSRLTLPTSCPSPAVGCSCQSTGSSPGVTACPSTALGPPPARAQGQDPGPHPARALHWALPMLELSVKTRSHVLPPHPRAGLLPVPEHSVRTRGLGARRICCWGRGSLRLGSWSGSHTRVL